MNSALRPLRPNLLFLLLPLFCAGCAHDATLVPATCSYSDANDGTQSYDILCREPLANHVKVKHILISWKELGIPGRPQDPRAAGRTYAEAQELCRGLLHKLQGGDAIEPLMKEYSEDPGSAETGQAYEASPDAPLVLQFKSLSLRLRVGEAGIVKSVFGLHVIQRTQ